jgi:uncharacterized membrane protein (Fun14 family)
VELGLRRSFKIFAPGSSLRRRVAYSLAGVRLVLVPVIFLAVYYLFKMGVIVDRIVNVDAPVATLAEQATALSTKIRVSPTVVVGTRRVGLLLSMTSTCCFSSRYRGLHRCGFHSW